MAIYYIIYFRFVNGIYFHRVLFVLDEGSILKLKSWKYQNYDTDCVTSYHAVSRPSEEQKLIIISDEDIQKSYCNICVHINYLVF